MSGFVLDQGFFDEIEPAWTAVRHDEHVTHREDYRACEDSPETSSPKQVRGRQGQAI
ncbi:hypothetical protein [Pleomorphovibrio marinus]|uniref:hypothetical protein n=1 Tax=Pleomorphovibrio marinus TaxID=2164132 RepID=UPI0018E50E22|nr:hypothetical protein [Pleomorphovibrio marinus]